MSSLFKNEAELANQVIEWLIKEGWTVHQEVMVSASGRTIDIVAEKDKKLWAIECKNTFTEAVLDQCYMHRNYVHYVSCAVSGYQHRPYRRSPSKKETSFVKNHFLQCFGIGLIRVNKDYNGKPQIHKEIEPEYQRLFKKNTDAKTFIKNISKIKNKFHDLHQTATAGAEGGQVTDYKITMYKVREYLVDKPATDPLDVAKNIKHHYRTANSLKQGILRGIENGWLPGLTKETVGRKTFIKFDKDNFNLDGSRKIST